MDVFLLRHGVAENSRPGFDDSARELTSEGRKRTREMMKLARALGLAPDYVLASPYVRAVQTAEVAAAALGYEAGLVRTPALTPDSHPERVWDEVRVYRGAAQLLLVGHEPLLSMLSAHLLNAPALLVDFKKGALMRIEIEAAASAPRGVLRWFLPSKLASVQSGQ